MTTNAASLFDQPSSDVPVIQLKQLTKKYGDFTAVDSLNLDIYPGEIYGLLGPNGAGKTTTILMMLGLAEPTSGVANVCGIDATRYPMQVKRKVGYMPDDVGFYDDRSALDNLIYTARLNRVPADEAKRRAAALLERVGLGDAVRKRVGTFSRGMRQRLGLADVLIKQPQVIILDEPTLGIDPEGVRELLALIHDLSRKEGLTVLLSSHHLHQVQQICDRVGLFVRGKLIASGDIETLSRQLDREQTFRVDMSLASWNEQLKQALLAVDRVERVEASPDAADGPVSVTVTGAGEVPAELAGTVIASGAVLRAFIPRTYGLDDIYHRYFEGGSARERLG